MNSDLIERSKTIVEDVVDMALYLRNCPSENIGKYQDAANRLAAFMEEIRCALVDVPAEPNWKAWATELEEYLRAKGDFGYPSILPHSAPSTSPPLSRQGEDSAEVERLRDLLSRAEEYVIDGVTNAKAEAEMNAPYPARAHRYDAALAEVRQLYTDIQGALAATRSGSATSSKDNADV